MINNNGGLQMYMGELNQFFAMHKGSRIIARFIVASQLRCTNIQNRNLGGGRTSDRGTNRTPIA